MSKKVIYKITTRKTVEIEVETDEQENLVRELNGDTERIATADKRYHRRYISLNKLCNSSFGEPQGNMLTPEEELLEKESQEELQALIQMALEGLTERQRELIHLRYWKERTLKEIAEQKDLHISTVAEGIDAAIKKIKKNLENFGKNTPKN